MYYPPCVYNPDSPNTQVVRGVNGNSPCIPFPAPPPACEKKNSVLGISQEKPCLNTDGGPCIDNKTYLARRFLGKY